MSVFDTDKCMGDFVENGITHVRFVVLEHICIGELNALRARFADTEHALAFVELESPARQPEFIDQFNSNLFGKLSLHDNDPFVVPWVFGANRYR